MSTGWWPQGSCLAYDCSVNYLERPIQPGGSAAVPACSTVVASSLTITDLLRTCSLVFVSVPLWSLKFWFVLLLLKRSEGLCDLNNDRSLVYKSAGPMLSH